MGWFRTLIDVARITRENEALGAEVDDLRDRLEFETSRNREREDDLVAQIVVLAKGVPPTPRNLPDERKHRDDEPPEVDEDFEERVRQRVEDLRRNAAERGVTYTAEDLIVLETHVREDPDMTAN